MKNTVNNKNMKVLRKSKREVQLHVLQPTLKYWIPVVGLLLQLGPVQDEPVGQLQSPWASGPVARYGHERGAQAEIDVKFVPGVVHEYGHEMHCVLEILPAYVPAGQGVQPGAKLVAEMNPGVQRVRPDFSS